MLELFKRRDWKQETLPRLDGSFEGLRVTLQSVPCLHDAKSGARKYSYPDFGFDLLAGLHEQLGDFDLLRAKLRAGAAVQIFVNLPSQSRILVELSGIAAASRRDFDSDLGDALIVALERAGLTRTGV
jgi:hypothetical protein